MKKYTRLTEAILRDASEQELSEFLLLTTIAREFFEKKFGFTVVGRDSSDEQLVSSPEWRLPRCSSAVLMKIDIASQRQPLAVDLQAGSAFRSG